MCLEGEMMSDELVAIVVRAKVLRSTISYVVASFLDIGIKC